MHRFQVWAPNLGPYLFLSCFGEARRALLFLPCFGEVRRALTCFLVLVRFQVWALVWLLVHSGHIRIRGPH